MRITCTVVLTIALAGCAAAPSQPELEAGPAARREAPSGGADRSAQACEHGQLLVSANDITTDGRVARIRGRVENPCEEKVEGVRYVVVLLAGEGDEVRELDSFQFESDVTLDPHQPRMMRLDLQSMYFGSTPGRFLVAAFPKKIGEREIPPPEGWR